MSLYLWQNQGGKKRRKKEKWKEKPSNIDKVAKIKDDWLKGGSEKYLDREPARKVQVLLLTHGDEREEERRGTGTHVDLRQDPCAPPSMDGWMDREEQQSKHQYSEVKQGEREREREAKHSPQPHPQLFPLRVYFFQFALSVPTDTNSISRAVTVFPLAAVLCCVALGFSVLGFSEIFS